MTENKKHVDKTSESAQAGNSNGTIYDDAFRTMQQKMPWLMIPIINDAFGKNYPLDTEVRRLPERYEKKVSKLIMDSCSMIGNNAYHLEVQSNKDGTMALRMLEYDLVLGIASARKVAGEFVVPLPRSCVIYIRHNGNTPDYEQATLVLPDGQTVRYSVPTVKVQEYTLDEIFEKKLYAYLPFYVMRYEHKFSKWEKDEKQQEFLQGECREALTRLSRELDDSPEEFMNLLEVMRRVADHVMRKQTALLERMDEVMGGKVWELPSDRIREEKAAERAEGKAEGRNINLVENLENLMKNLHLTLQEACKALGITEQEYQAAKKQLQ